MTTSSIRIHNSNGDVTHAYVGLYNSDVPLTGLTAGLPGTQLSTTLARVAQNGKQGGDDGGPLSDEQFEHVARISAAGEGTFITPNGWAVTVTPDVPARRLLGMDIGPRKMFGDGRRGVVQIDEHPTVGGNTVLRAGHLVGNSWERTEHIVLTSAERRALILDLIRQETYGNVVAADVATIVSEVLDEVRANDEASDVHSPADLRADVAARLEFINADDLDTSSSNSRQHYIDTGEYLTRREVAESSSAQHPEHIECADGCGIDVTHTGPCLDKPGGRVVCDEDNHHVEWSTSGSGV